MKEKKLLIPKSEKLKLRAMKYQAFFTLHFAVTAWILNKTIEKKMKALQKLINKKRRVNFRDRKVKKTKKYQIK